jgi:hypothetical protein
MPPNTRTTLMRLRRKAEIVHNDLKAQNDNRYHDLAEILNLIALLERAQAPHTDPWP